MYNVQSNVKYKKAKHKSTTHKDLIGNAITDHIRVRDSATLVTDKGNPGPSTPRIPRLLIRGPLKGSHPRADKGRITLLCTVVIDLLRQTASDAAVVRCHEPYCASWYSTPIVEAAKATRTCHQPCGLEGSKNRGNTQVPTCEKKVYLRFLPRSHQRLL